MATYFSAGGVTGNLFAITESAVVLPDPDGTLTVRDPHTGKVRVIISADPGWTYGGIGVVGTRLYAYMDRSNEYETRFAAYDLHTGHIVWRTDLDGTYTVGISINPIMITSRGIVIQIGTSGGLQGLRLADGKSTWLTWLPTPCSSGDTATSPTATVFLLECKGDGVRLISVDPANGHTAWQHLIAASQNDVYPIELLTTDNGDILAVAGTTTRIYSPDGRLLLTRTPPLTCPERVCMVGIHGSNAVIELNTTPTTPIVQGINLTTGARQWQRTGDLLGLGEQTMPVDSNGTLFTTAGQSLVGDQRELIPAFILALQTRTGQSTLLPLPTSHRASTLVGTADGLLFVQSSKPGGFFITAYQPETTAPTPISLGGVPTTDWPNACTLITPADLHTIATGYVSAPKNPTLTGTTWPKPETCAYVGPTATDPAVTVTIAWIASTTQQANELVTSELAALANTMHPPSRITTGQYLEPDDTLNQEADRALIVVGRAIVTVTVPDHPDDARKLAPIVAARLNAYRQHKQY